jgi:hypothetical protein
MEKGHVMEAQSMSFMQLHVSHLEEIKLCITSAEG